MAVTRDTSLFAQAGKRTKIETTYEYVPILGQILGIWKTLFVNRIGTKIELHIKTDLGEYDNLFINGIEIDISRYKELKKDN